MSIAVLAQTQEEARRLAIAGSAVAPGDFRLKKLIPALEKAGEKAPVFAKVAQAAQAVVDANEKTAPQALLDLAGLLSAILYTQGETGAAGALEPIELVQFRASPTQASARTLKPLLEALATTGSGRLEIVADAIQQGVFNDLRLVLPALRALDDPYPEIAERIQREVLPKYGRAIIGELLAQLEAKRGRVSDTRRLRLLHSLDPQAARAIVKQSLEEGSKELRVAAIACLGSDEEDLGFLLEQATSKAKDVRVAALSALMQVQSEASLSVLKARVPKDLESLIQPLRDATWPALSAWLVEQTRAQLAQLLAMKDEQGKETLRLLQWLHVFVGRVDPNASAVLIELFDKRALLAKIKTTPSGADVNERVAFLMGSGDTALAKRLIDQQAELTGAALQHAFLAARRTLGPAEVYERFGPTAETARRGTGAKSAEQQRWEAIRTAIRAGGQASWHYGSRRTDDQPVLDTRWIDLAIALEDLPLVEAVSQPGHAALLAYLSSRADQEKSDDRWPHLLGALIRCEHPKLVETVLGLLAAKNAEAVKGRAHTHVWLIAREIPALPATAIAPLEALLPTMHERLIDQLVGAIEQLKDRHRAAK